MSNLKTPFVIWFVGKFFKTRDLRARRVFDNGDIGYDELKKVEDETITELVIQLSKS